MPNTENKMLEWHEFVTTQSKKKDSIPLRIITRCETNQRFKSFNSELREK